MNGLEISGMTQDISLYNCYARLKKAGLAKTGK